MTWRRQCVSASLTIACAMALVACSDPGPVEGPVVFADYWSGVSIDVQRGGRTVESLSPEDLVSLASTETRAVSVQVGDVLVAESDGPATVTLVDGEALSGDISGGRWTASHAGVGQLFFQVLPDDPDAVGVYGLAIDVIVRP